MATFPIRIGRKSGPVLLLFGVRSDADVTLEGGKLIVRFGFYRLETPIANIRSWRIEGPFHWIKAIGVRRSVRGGDVTFGGSPHGGVRIDFRAPVAWLRGLLRTPATYVTVDDLEGLGAELARLGIQGTDARIRTRPAEPSGAGQREVAPSPARPPDGAQPDATPPDPTGT